MKKNRQLLGKGISPGFVRGKAYIFKDILERDYKLYSITEQETENEYTRIEQAFENILNDLTRLTKRVERELDGDFADIFSSHKMILKDPSLLQDIKTELEKERVNAERVIKTVFARYQYNLSSMEHSLLRDRADDIADLAKRLLRSLLGVEHLLETVPSDVILVSKRLLPSDIVFLRKKSVSGIVVEYCGTASHSAILAREMGIPAVAGITDILEIIENGEELLIDGITGRVILHPDDEQREDFNQRKREYDKVLVNANKSCQNPAITRDGTRISVMANIGSFEDALIASRNGADGIGLYRLEQLYFRQKTLPIENEISNKLCMSLKPVEDLPITIRLLDTCADKELPYLNYPPETNPLFGRRGIRLLLDYRELMSPQINVLLKLSLKFSLRILIPMVTLAEDMRQVREIIETTAKQLGINKIPPVGAMIETPAAALCAAEIARYADFFSIGTNDLTQYVMAAGREEEFLSHYYIQNHPAVLKLMHQVCEAIPDYEIEVCGELAGYPEAIPVLLEMGIKHLSVLPLRIPIIKERIRNVR